ncbi:glycosyl hydrolase family 114 [Microterricola gilva]|uniref:Glycosyl hydrolase family 114 n=1 Tax=Microterricola gilva TaxID=393267 RepID=A0A4Q8AMK3_9MICO|nr:endo alpha-1,4 polygalactosaminidase [Microterricola gilva]RZU65149.1 glycosyl hydrolase family 114 [Microterricola gilva]
MTEMHARLIVVAALCVLALTGCTAAPDAAATVRLPPTSGGFDYQLGGAYDTAAPAAVVVRDVTAQPLPGAYNVCYVNGFQTQPGDAELWTAERGELLLRDADGAFVIDPNWPDEYILDPSSESSRRAIFGFIAPLISECAEKGFDAVDLDNLDIASRFTDAASGRIDPAGVLALAGMYVDRAHDDGLAIGQKNAAEMADAGHREIGFDFAVAEGCAAYGECAAYRDVYGEHVLQIEYTDNLPTGFDAVCAADDRAPLTILRDRPLSTPGGAGYAYEQCPDGP